MGSPIDSWIAERSGLGHPVDPAELAAWQGLRLREALARAFAHSPFYRRRLSGIDLEGGGDRELLERIPFTYPAQLVNEGPAFLCLPPEAVARIASLYSSGTEGTHKRVYFSAADLERTVDFFDFGMRELVEPGDRCLVLFSSRTEHSIARLLETALARRGIATIIREPAWGASEALDAAGDCDCIVGMPAQLHYLSRLAPRLRPKTVLLSADYVPRSIVGALEAAWPCRVFSHYGMTELGYGCAVQCAGREGHHLRSLDHIIEIVDPNSGRVLAPGNEGELVITTLRNEAMPLFRYRTGDRSSLCAEPCVCGSALPRLQAVTGRIAGIHEAAAVGCPSIHELDELLFSIPSLRNYEARLGGLPSAMQLRINADLEEGGEPEAIERRLRERLPPGLGLELDRTTIDPIRTQGKRRITREMEAR
ncbi:MAG TPA: AMP-binding protein [Rectinemataceae bacterium]|nr:AMP-binding protein [Rectinemataceae bacterium]